MTLGERIRAARERLRLKQPDIADTLGVTVQAVSNWERDVDRPDPDRLAALRKQLKVTYAWLIEGAGPAPQPDDHRVLTDDAASAEYRALGAKNASQAPKVAKRG